MRELLLERAALQRRCRTFLEARGVVEADTPTLWPSTIPDPAIESIAVQAALAFGRQGPGLTASPHYLQTSPEFALKRLVAASGLDLYELKHVFRNEPISVHHHPEFLMLEWYRQGFDDDALMREVAELLQELLEVPLAVETLSFQQAFERVLNIDPFTASLDQLHALAFEHCHYRPASPSAHTAADAQSIRDGLTDLFMGAVIGPQLGREGLCFITDYPISQAALAKAHPNNPGVAARFEAYFRGIELCNGFDELTDADQQRARFIADNDARVRRGQSPIAIDDDFINALPALGAVAGVALGLDRVLQLKLAAPSITDVIPLPLSTRV